MSKSSSRVGSKAPAVVAEVSRDLATHIQVAEAAASNEAAFREASVPLLKATVAELYGIDPLTMPPEVATRTKDGVSRFADNLMGGVVVEWEFKMTEGKGRAHGAYQALEYLHLFSVGSGDDGQQPALIDAPSGVSDTFTAVVSDGRYWGFLSADPFRDFYFPDLEEADAAQFFQWVPHSEAAVQRFLELIGDHRRTPITPLVLANMFGPSSDVGRETVSLLLAALGARDPDSRTETLYREWRRAMDVVHGDLDDSRNAVIQEVAEAYQVNIDTSLGEVLFVLHTYFALVTRLVAGQFLATAVQDTDFLPTRWALLGEQPLLESMRRFDSGELPGGLEISNLFESDLFSWYLDGADGDHDLVDGIRRVLLTLDQLAFPRAAHGPLLMGDVLRDVYQRIVPAPLRRALGEFLTPHWLAEACRARLEDCGAPLDNGRVLDPTCGTGTFITPILARRVRDLRRANPQPAAQQVQELLNGVAGIDLNPVAVIATRANFVMALGDLASVGPLTLSVWRADSLVVPEPSDPQAHLGHPLSGRSYREISTSLDESFSVPARVAKVERLAILRRLIEFSIREFEATGIDSTAAFLQEFTDTFGPTGDSPITSDASEFTEEYEVAEHLYGSIQALAAAGRNGVWAGIIENAFAPAFAGKFDIVLGNPPWLAWPKLPPAWRGDAQRLWERYGLWEFEREVGQPLTPQFNDISVLVFAVAIDRYAKKNGWVGFLTPQALLLADPGARAFRQFRLKSKSSDPRDHVDIRVKPVHIDDWSQVRPFSPDAANNPVFIVARKGKKAHSNIKGSVWRRVVARSSLARSWPETRTLLVEDVGNYAPIDPGIPTSALRFQSDSAPNLIAGGSNSFPFGMGLNTRGANGVLFVDVLGVEKRNGKVRLKNIPNRGRNGAIKPVTATVEADLVYPLLRGRDVKAWTAVPQGYMLLPHDPNSWDKVLTPAKWKSYPSAHRWLRKFKPILSHRTTIASARWDLAGDDWCRVEGPFDHMSREHLVVVREQSERPAAALVEEYFDYQLNRKVRPLIDHKLIFCALHSRDEALYLAAFINSTPIQDLIASFGNATAISPTTMRRLPIPPFEATNSSCAAIVKAAKEIMDSPVVSREATAALLQSKIDSAVLVLVAADPATHKPQPRRRTRATSSNTQPTTLF